jgi:hypothetical protein
MLMIAYWIIQLDWTPWTKYWAVLAGTLFSSVAIYQFAIRPFGTLRVLFGLSATRQPKPNATLVETGTMPSNLC